MWQWWSTYHEAKARGLPAAQLIGHLIEDYLHGASTPDYTEEYFNALRFCHRLLLPQTFVNVSKLHLDALPQIHIDQWCTQGALVARILMGYVDVCHW